MKMMKVPRKHRISVDRDNRNQFQLLKTHFNMRWICGNVFDWETTKGYHIYGRFPDRTIEQNLNVRRLLGDDIERIILDEGRIQAGVSHLAETLFVFGKEKEHRQHENDYGKIYRSIEYPCNVLSEQFWGVRIGKN